MHTGLLIAGMFRSGTTLLAGLINDHPDSLVVSDPFVYFFKHYRNHHLAALGLNDWQADEPTPDYFGGARRELFESLMEANLSEPMPAATLKLMIADIRRWKCEQHPLLCDSLDRVAGGSFAEVYSSLIDLAVEIYGDEGVRLAGTKVSWCEEFLPAMGRAFPEMQFVLPVRDLRAVIASQNSQTIVGVGRRPLLFYVRHWRKSVALAHYYAEHHPLLKDRVQLVRYEDLVREPEAFLETLTRRVGLSSKPLQVSVGSDGLGHNSSFGSESNSPPPTRGVFTHSTDRWREVLSIDEVRAIEAFAAPEMALLGYPLSAPPVRPQDCLTLDCEPPFDLVASWLKPFAAAAYLCDDQAREREYAAEERRRLVLDQGLAPSLAVQNELFLVPHTWQALKDSDPS
jgi:hypothetical protein